MWEHVCAPKEVMVGLEVSALKQTIHIGPKESVRITRVNKGRLFSSSSRLAGELTSFSELTIMNQVTLGKGN